MKSEVRASLFRFQEAKAALARVVTNEDNSIEVWLVKSCSVAKWKEALNSPQLSDEQILESVVVQSSFQDESSGDQADEGQDNKIFSNSEAIECFKKCLFWKERQNNVDAIRIMQLRRMIELSIRTRYSSLGQPDWLRHFRPI